LHRVLHASSRPISEQAEGDLFGPTFQRTSIAELEMLLAESHFVVLECTASAEHDIQGCMYLKKSDATTAMFGMLAVPHRARGLGHARRLLDFASTWARANACDALQLSLLSPRDEPHAHKAFLEAWYRRSGFQMVKEMEFSWTQPMAKVCQFRLFSMSLAAVSQT
jgi:GNAT superfamily N-acetyltransferase